MFSLSILGGVFGLFSLQSFFFVGEVSVVLLLASKTTAVFLCNRACCRRCNFKNRQLRICCSKTTVVFLSHVILIEL
jgi:hypothetical protein